MTDVFDGFPEAAPAPSKKRALASLTAALTCMAVMTTALVIGPAVAAGTQAKAAVNWWDDIEVDLTQLPSTLPGHVTVTDKDGNTFATLYSENRVAANSLDEISDVMIEAVLATEDNQFYEHGPIDFRGTARALLRNKVTGTAEGGSTITQQYVKNLRIIGAEDDAEAAAATETSLRRKIVELKWAAEIEQERTKDEILLGYLNAAYFGNGAYGVGAAARFYFGVSASELTLPQAALLTGLLKNPSGYDPLTHPQAAADRRTTILARMVAAERITQDEANAANAEPLAITPHPLPNGCTVSPYPYYCQWVKNVLLSDPAFGDDEPTRERNLYDGGFTVKTALDPAHMAAAQEAASAAFGNDNDVAAAVAVVTPGTGHVTAIAQTRTYTQTEFIYPVQAQVQPGSTFKPITLAAALEQGFDPGTLLGSSVGYHPSGMNAPKGGFGNADGRDRGMIDAATAMKFSVNTWFVRLLEKTGTEAVADMAFRLGMTSMDPATRRVGEADASLTLGAFEATPLDVANVYATLAASGVRCRPLPIVAVTDAHGNPLPAPDPQCEQVIDPSVAQTVARAMETTFSDGGTAQGLGLDRPAVGKTGTTNSNGATWFAGFTPLRSTAVWVGDPRGPAYPLQNVVAYGKRHTRLYGSTVAGPIWKQTMAAVTAGDPSVGLPEPGPLMTSGRAVPDVTGLDVTAAIDALQRAGFTVSVAKETAPGRSMAPGTVVGQMPTGGSVPLIRDVQVTLVDGSDTNVTVEARR